MVVIVIDEDYGDFWESWIEDWIYFRFKKYYYMYENKMDRFLSFEECDVKFVILSNGEEIKVE